MIGLVGGWRGRGEGERGSGAMGGGGVSQNTDVNALLYLHEADPVLSGPPAGSKAKD